MKTETANIGIETNGREKLAGELNSILADEFTLYVKLRNFHWNVVAPNFSELHKLFETQYDQVDETIDELAERVRALGYRPLARMADYVKEAGLKEAPTDLPAKDMLKQALADHETMAVTLRQSIELAGKHNDPGTADLLTRIIQDHEKAAWMLRAHLG